MLIATHAEKLDIMLMNVLQKEQYEMMCSVSPVKALGMCLEYVLAKKHRIKNKEHKEEGKKVEVVSIYLSVDAWI